MKRRYIPNIIKACYLSFQGMEDSKVAEILGVSGPTVSRWRKENAWKETEKKLIEKQIEKEINEYSKEEFDVSR